jgi:DNA-binding response OmpR family regulator
VASKAAVLLVDDNDALRIAVASALTWHGYKVLEAGDGVTAIDLYTEHSEQVALAILDLNLPDTSGTELAHSLHLHNSLLPVLFCSAMPRESFGDRDAAYIQKPYRVAELVSQVRLMLDRKRSAAMT